VIAPVTASTPNFETLFPFTLDPFQEQAIAALEAERSLVVCAPTGSGKTLIGEYAIFRALSRGRRVFYTTPLKALSNQKWRDFSQQFGPDQVGLLTGDMAINRQAPVVVMTTEIFRNMLYGTPIGEVGTSLVGVEVVVLDECHYMNDRQRGTVWEEAVIYCPPTVQLLALSATVANSEQLTAWIDKVHGPTELVYSEFRPVPLQLHFCTARGLAPLLDGSRKRLNPKLKFRSHRHRGGNRRNGQPESPTLPFVLKQLQERDMLPAIYFIFSRRGCDQAVQVVRNQQLLTPEEAQRLQVRVDDFLGRNPSVGRLEHIDSLYRGVAAHHAGLLPGWKALVEDLFQQGLVKVVFATETLAAGINMPARTTVISSLSKRTDRGHRLLNPSEFLQIAGRAGRRGMDDKGYVVTLQTNFEGAREAAYLGTATADPLVSQFTPSYGMVLNLLQTHTLPETRELVERSFGQYLATQYLQPQEQCLADLRADWEELGNQLQQVNPAEIADYEKLRQRLREERRLLKTLKKQARAVNGEEMAIAVTLVPMGTILTVVPKPDHDPKSMVLVTTVPGSGQFPHLVCLSPDNHWLVIAVNQVVQIHTDWPNLPAVEVLDLPLGLALVPDSNCPGERHTLEMSHQLQQVILHHADVLPSDQPPEVQAQLTQVMAVKKQLDSHPIHRWGDPGKLSKCLRRLATLEAEIGERQAALDQLAEHHWQEFVVLLDILREFDCLTTDPQDPEPGDRWHPTSLGEIAADLRGDNELWLALALNSGYLDHLAPDHLAATCATLVTDVSRPDTWVRYDLAPEVDGILGQLWPLRKQLLKAQARDGVEFLVLPTTWEDRRLSALVEQWTAGAEWTDLCANTNLAEGDIVRIVRRALDCLCQIPHARHLSADLKRTARQAIHLIDRSPVNLIDQVFKDAGETAEINHGGIASDPMQSKPDPTD